MALGIVPRTDDRLIKGHNGFFAATRTIAADDRYDRPYQIIDVIRQPLTGPA